MAKFSKKSIIDRNFAEDDCDQFKDVKEFIARKSPNWEKKIAEMEKRAQEKKIRKDLLNDIFENAPTEAELLVKKIGIWGGIIIGAILLIMMSSCFGGNNVETAPVPVKEGSNLTLGGGIIVSILLVVGAGVLLTILQAMLKGGMFEG